MAQGAGWNKIPYFNDLCGGLNWNDTYRLIDTTGW